MKVTCLFLRGILIFRQVGGFWAGDNWRCKNNNITCRSCNRIFEEIVQTTDRQKYLSWKSWHIHWNDDNNYGQRSACKMYELQKPTKSANLTNIHSYCWFKLHHFTFRLVIWLLLCVKDIFHIRNNIVSHQCSSNTVTRSLKVHRILFTFNEVESK